MDLTAGSLLERTITSKSTCGPGHFKFKFFQMSNIPEKKKQKIIDQALLEEMGIDKEELKKLKKKLAKAEAKPERGIETWFRLASKNLYSRLQIVDAKANILITANAIIISVVLGTLYARLDDDPHLIYAITGMVVTNVLSISFAILATIPKAWRSKPSVTSLGSTDLMTFEEFSGMSLADYRDSVMKTLNNANTLYPSIITDIHKLGVKLARKYRLIRASYLIFLYGIIISVLLFGICHAMF